MCSDQELSRLDDQLGTTYAQLQAKAPHPADSKKEQLQWLHDVRNACESSECLRKAYLERLAGLKTALASASGGSTCKVGRNELIGYWELRSGSAYFEEMSIAPDGQFDSWLHHHPEVAGGAWTYKNCVLAIKHTVDDTTPVEYVVTRYKNDRLYILYAGDKNEAIYRRIK